MILIKLYIVDGNSKEKTGENGINDEMLKLMDEFFDGNIEQMKKGHNNMVNCKMLKIKLMYFF